jgi:HEAT repeat protein
MQESRSPSRTRLSNGLRALALLVLAGLTSCVSSGKDIPRPGDEGYQPMGPATRKSHSIGKYLADLNTSIAAWNAKSLTASTSQEVRKHNLLEVNIRERVKNRFEEIMRELEAGPTRNRQIAAGAIGFAGDSRALSPLLGALKDADERVVGNALVSLGLLAIKETPMHEIGNVLRNSTNSRTRWSAANAALELIGAGADPNGIVEPARFALTDHEEPAVRSQAALVLALVEDVESLDALGELIFDDVPLVSTAAALAISKLGRKDPRSVGKAARLLYAGLEQGDRKLRLRVQPALVQLADRNYDLNLTAWKEWIDSLH